MATSRILTSDHTISLSTGETAKIIHSTGNFSLLVEKATFSGEADIAGSGFALPSGYGTIDTSSVEAFINGEPVNITSYISGFALFDTSFSIGDTITFTFYSSGSNREDFTGGGLLDIAVNNGEVISPGTSIVSIETSL